MILVADSSVVAKWYFAEEDFVRARKLLEQHRTYTIQIAAPILLFFELGNIFINKKMAITANFAKNFQDLLNVNLTIVEVNTLILATTFAIATKYKLSFYDAAYVAVAQSLNCDFVTADEKLYKTCKNLGFVKLLSEYTNTTN